MTDNHSLSWLCAFWHKWGIWKPSPVYKDEQIRTCNRCGYRQVKDDIWGIL